VKKIVKKGNRVTGVIAENISGQEIQAHSKAVVVATGGFIDSTEWLKKYLGLDWGKNCFSYRIPGLVGDGIQMAWEAGAAATEMNMLMIFSMPTNIPIPFPIEFTLHQPSNIMVNMLGERFVDETVDAMQVGKALRKQKDGCAVIIFDEDAKNDFIKTGWDWLPGDMPFSRATGFDEDLKKALSQGLNSVIIADSLEDLAGKTGIDLQGLRNTLDEYNRDCENKQDRFLYKSPKYLRQIKQPKFYAVKVFPGGFGTLGGIKINYKTEVLTKDFTRIPGLFASGQDACSIYGDIYNMALPGNTLGFAINSGRIAGENAVEYIKSLNN
jgi:fumarate reductase flavoprotein subunit